MLSALEMIASFERKKAAALERRARANNEAAALDAVPKSKWYRVEVKRRAILDAATSADAEAAQYEILSADAQRRAQVLQESERNDRERAEEAAVNQRENAEEAARDAREFGQTVALGERGQREARKAKTLDERRRQATAFQSIRDYGVRLLGIPTGEDGLPEETPAYKQVVALARAVSDGVLDGGIGMTAESAYDRIEKMAQGPASTSPKEARAQTEQQRKMWGDLDKAVWSAGSTAGILPRKEDDPENPITPEQRKKAANAAYDRWFAVWGERTTPEQREEALDAVLRELGL